MDEIFPVSKDVKRANSLKEMALDRLKDVKNIQKPYKIIEEDYEIIKELITALMYADGFKTLSHKSLILYLQNKYKKEFSEKELILIDKLRVLRNDIMYYGKKVDSSFLTNNKEGVKLVIDKLLKVLENHLKG